MSVKNYFTKDSFSQLFAFAVVMSIVTALAALFIYSVFLMSDSEKVFQKNVMVHHHEALKEHNVHSVEVYTSSTRMMVSGDLCSISVTIVVDGQKVTDSFLSEKSYYRDANCSITFGFSSIRYQPPFMGFPEAYRADIDPDLIIDDQDDAVDLEAVRNIRKTADKLLPKIVEFSQKMQAEYESLALDDI